MVISLLSYLIDIHELSVNDLSKKCGISRPALTALVNNTGKGIQFDTISKLCKFFHIGVSDLLLLINESTCRVYVDTSSLDESGKKIVCDAKITIGTRDIKGECIASLNDGFVEAELRPSRDISDDDEAFLESITGSKEAYQFISSVLEKDLGLEFATYDECDVSVWF